jgi:hypothetical protein
MLFSRKLIPITFERISEHPTGKIRIGTITFPIKEQAGLNPVKIAASLLNGWVL